MSHSPGHKSTTSKSSVVSGLKSPSEYPQSHGSVDSAVHMNKSPSDDDRAVSDWETVAGDDECIRPPVPVLAVDFQTGVAQVTVTPESELDNFLEFNSSKRQPAMVLFSTENSRQNFARSPELLSVRAFEDPARFASSVYSDGFQQECVVGGSLNRLHGVEEQFVANQQHPAILQLQKAGEGDITARCSRTSSSLSMERFKYDAGVYSVFLNSSNERQPCKTGAKGVAAPGHDAFYDPTAIKSA
ncbi:hypothetical protein HIM_03191 [Hirsutella minnesotensis 3608]|nr:hypothetical protein HIM_03191 [Hirsutella minnesotensis 3608]